MLLNLLTGTTVPQHGGPPRDVLIPTACAPQWADFNHLYCLAALRNHYHILRHGESTANQERRWVSSPTSCLDKYGLSPLGRQQVRASVKAQIRDGSLNQPTQIIASDYLRARESGDEAFLLLGGAAPLMDDRLRERGCGEMEGRVFSPDEGADVVRSINEQDRADPFSAPFGQESTVAVMARFTSLIADLEATHSDTNYLLVCHGDILRIALCAARKVSPGDHAEFGHIPNAAIFHLNHFFTSAADSPHIERPR